MKFAFEGILMLLMLASAIFFVGIPLIKLVKLLMPASKTDPVSEAQKRLDIARKEAEAARLNKETEQVYDKLYEEVLQDDKEEDNERTVR